MVKHFKISDYLDSLNKEKNTNKEDKFLIVQTRIQKNLSQDIMELLDSLESGGIPAPKDFVFMTYFVLFWNRMMVMYETDQEKQDIIGLFNSVMQDKNGMGRHMKQDSLN
jgi:hypothetical protein